MKGFMAYFLHSYQDQDFITRVRSRIVFYLTFLVLSVLVLVMILTVGVIQDKDNRIGVLIPLGIALIITLLVFIFLRRGKLVVASNLIIIISLSAVWSVIFTSKSKDFYTQLDTIVFVMIIQVIVPLLTNLRGIIIYNAVILTAFAVFVKVVLIDTLQLQGVLFGDYVMDNSISLVTIAALTFLIYKINDQALQRSETEAEKNREQLNVISNILESVQKTSEKLALSSQELSTASRVLSGNAQSQAASSEEITATVEEISAGVDNITNSTVSQTSSMDSLLVRMDEFSGQVEKTRGELKDLLQQTEEITSYAQTGDSNLKLMNESMLKISDSSGEMSNIISMINDISDQINLLSLNAAIEAARAGDAGRGFAVVADEISKLADRTSQSVKEISSLIAGNNSEIINGRENVEVTVGTLNKIITGIKGMYDMMQGISSQITAQVTVNSEIQKETGMVKEQSDTIKIATEEQKTASEEIVKSISTINEASQANASGSEEIAGNAEEIAAIADQLKKEVEIYGAE